MGSTPLPSSNNLSRVGIASGGRFRDKGGISIGETSIANLVKLE
ncbi:hypothetical protein NC652_027830 [Populus alba x Populus x berolinensis]|nr:hypothetical protein NC651_026841 [Populus alba x Populus x berolinensis]KAJ6893876.1 hypothetical protein NC652_027830 [Populus alba x Populus x berolinensis]